MPIEDVIGDIIEREGGSKVTNDPADGGGRTQYGISERSNPEAWADNKVTEEEARAIYVRKYVEGPHFDLVTDPLLRAQLIDFGVNSGPAVAIMKLQEILQVEVDGKLGPETLGALSQVHPDDINNLLAGSRVRMIGRIVQKNPSQLKFLSGWLNRATEFLK
jgi:lysozyme family protein